MSSPFPCHSRYPINLLHLTQFVSVQFPQTTRWLNLLKEEMLNLQLTVIPLFNLSPEPPFEDETFFFTFFTFLSDFHFLFIAVSKDCLQSASPSSQFWRSHPFPTLQCSSRSHTSATSLHAPASALWPKDHITQALILASSSLMRQLADSHCNLRPDFV